MGDIYCGKAEKSKHIRTVITLGIIFYSLITSLLTACLIYFELRSNLGISNIGSSIAKSWLISSLVSLVVSIVVSLIVAEFYSNILVLYTNFFAKVGLGQMRHIPTKAKDFQLNSTGMKRLFQKAGSLFITSDEHGQEFQQMSYAYNQMVESLGEMISKVQDESTEVADKSNSLLDLSAQTTQASEEVAQAVTGIAEVTSSQAEDTQESVDEMQIWLSLLIKCELMRWMCKNHLNKQLKSGKLICK